MRYVNRTDYQTKFAVAARVKGSQKYAASTQLQSRKAKKKLNYFKWQDNGHNQMPQLTYSVLAMR